MSITSAKQSRWGSFLQQAVAGVEARLDTILTDIDEGLGASSLPDESDSLSTAAQLKESSLGMIWPWFVESSGMVSCSLFTDSNPNNVVDTGSLPTRAPDRLQARLAKAVAVRSTSPPVTTTVETIHGMIAHKSSEPSASVSAALRISSDSSVQALPAQSRIIQQSQVNDNESLVDSTTNVMATYTLEDERLVIPQSPDDVAQRYAEQNEFLWSKIRFLTAELVAATRFDMEAQTPESLKHQLAHKTEQWALLLREGQASYLKEEKLTASIRKLTAQVRATTAATKQITSERDTALDEASTARTSISHVHELETKLSEASDVINMLKEQVASLHRDKEAKAAELDALQSRQVEVTVCSNATGTFPNSQVQIDKLESELIRTQAESDLVSQRATERISQLEEALKVNEVKYAKSIRDRGWEVKALENKLEAAQTRAEEAATRTTGDAQLALMRQLDTVQSQYASASKNWEGIESSLVTRALSLERERDDALRSQQEIRKRAKESVCSHIIMHSAATRS